MNTTEKILIVYSVKGTPSEDIAEAESAVRQFDRMGSTVKVEPIVFKIPEGVSAGTTLCSELYDNLLRSIGAIVFVDDLRFNIAYEIGFFHGQGKLVLLITKKNIEEFWLLMSDLAGTSLARVDKISIQDYVINYLNRLYDDLALSDFWDSTSFPRDDRNLINNLIENIDQKSIIDTEFGKGIKITEWDKKIDINISRNLCPNSKFNILIRENKHDSLYSIYFKIRYSDNTTKNKHIWIGLSSVKRAINLQGNERLVPSRNSTKDWSIIQGTFEDLFKKCLILGKIKIDSLSKIRLRAGSNRDKNSSDIEIGYLNIIGLE